MYWQSHVGALVTCRGFTPQGEFLQVPELEKDRLRAAWNEAVLALDLA